MIRHFLLIALSIIVGCDQDRVVPVSSCSSDPPTSTFNNEMALQFSDLLDEYIVQGYPGLVMAVVDSNNNHWVDARGFAVVENQEPLSSCHLHHSASISKTYIATLIMMLYQDGLIELDAPLHQYLSIEQRVENFNCVTIRQLLGHQSGIFDFDTNPRIFVDYLNEPFQIENWQQILERYVSDRTAYFQCGESTRYSDTNYLLLGVLVEAVTQQSLGEVMQKRILGPFGLSETFYKESPGYPDIDGTTNNYFYFRKEKIQNCTDWQQHFANISMGHEGIIASPLDYLRFLQLLLGGYIISEPTLSEMMVYHQSDQNQIELGLGLELFHTPAGEVWGHTGGGFGTMALLLYEPDTGTTFFLASNLGSIFESAASNMFYEALLNDLVEIIKSSK